METNSNTADPARSVGGSNVSSELPLASEDEAEHSDGNHGINQGEARGLYIQRVARGGGGGGGGGGGPAPSFLTAGHSIFTEPRRLPNGITGSTSTVHGAGRQGFSNGDSNAQAASAGVSFEGPAAAATNMEDEEVQFDEVAGPIRRMSNVSMRGPSRSREDDDSAEARFEEADEGEELDSQRVVGQEAVGGSMAVGVGGEWQVQVQCDDNSADIGGSADMGTAGGLSTDLSGGSKQPASEEAKKTSNNNGGVHCHPHHRIEEDPEDKRQPSVEAHVSEPSSTHKRDDDEVSIGNVTRHGSNWVRDVQEACGSPADSFEGAPQIAEASHRGAPITHGRSPVTVRSGENMGERTGSVVERDTREWFERERWELELKDCLRASLKHKQDGHHLFSLNQLHAADVKFLRALKYVEFETVFEGEDEATARSLKMHCLVNSAACKLKLAQFKEAVELCSRAIELDGGNEKSLYHRAHANIALGDLEGGEADLTRAALLNPQDQHIEYTLSELHRRRKLYQQNQKRMCLGIFEDRELSSDAQIDSPSALPAVHCSVKRDGKEINDRHQSSRKASSSEDATVETHAPERKRQAKRIANGQNGRMSVMKNAHPATVNSGDADRLDLDGESEEEGDEFVSPAICSDVVAENTSDNNAH